MRLMDQVAQATAPVWLEDSSGVFALRGAGSKADDVRSTPLRYVLDDIASRQCWNFICDNERLIDPVDPALRIPARQFWLEWFVQNRPDRTARAGYLVEASEGGRQGSVQSFWECPGRDPEMGQARVVFDLDNPVQTGQSAFRLRSVEQGPIGRLVEHLAIEMAPEWVEALSANGQVEYRHAVGRIADAMWSDLALVLGFQRILMLSQEGVRSSRVERGPLNSLRARTGKPALLDHVEITLRLGGSGRVHESWAGAGARAASRRHLVNGHFVNRNGKHFWRRAHERCAAVGGLLSKTVSVRGAGD